MTDPNAGSTARRPRPWIIVPPASARPVGQIVAGTEILTELTGSVRVLVWLLYRDLQLCVAVARERRAGLFRPRGLRAFDTVAIPAAVAAHIRALSGSLDNVSAAEAAACCGAIAAWARPHAPRTALLFTETAARAQPASGVLAREVGLLALACDLAPQGVAWLHRALVLGRNEGDMTTVARAHMDLADHAESMRHFRLARIQYRRARRIQRLHALGRSVRARAAVGLLRAALRDGDSGGAQLFTGLAVRSFDPSDSRSTQVHLHVARALMDASRYSDVVAVLRTRPPTTDAAKRIALAALAVRAAARLGDLDSVVADWEEFVAAAAEAGSAKEIRETISAVLSAIPGTPRAQLQAIRAEAVRLARSPRL